MMKREAIIVVDLSFGDAGKGSMVDYLVRKHQTHTVIRFNGGSQAAHNVVTDDGRHHTFSQFGSGTFVPGVRTYLSQFVLVNPIALLEEGKKLIDIGVADALSRIDVDERALITTPFHWAANRLKEMARGDARHGSCGKGIGETMADWLRYGEQMLFVGDLRDENIVRKKLEFHQQVKREQLRTVIDKLPMTEAVLKELDLIFDPEIIDLIIKFYKKFVDSVHITNNVDLQKLLNRQGKIILEGAQGALIDEWYGFHPYTTWSTTTAKNALELLSGYKGKITKLGLIRAYATRHGAGPFVSEVEALSRQIPDIHNDDNKWQEKFRVGWLDLVALKYAIAINQGIDSLAITNLDRFEELDDWQVVNAYTLKDVKNEVQDKYFQRDSNSIIGIMLKKDVEDLEYQAELTNLLQNCRPVYSDISGKKSKRGNAYFQQRTRNYVEFLERELSVAVVYLSKGMTAKDKYENKKRRHKNL